MELYYPCSSKAANNQQSSVCSCVCVCVHCAVYAQHSALEPSGIIKPIMIVILAKTRQIPYLSKHTHGGDWFNGVRVA